MYHNSDLLTTLQEHPLQDVTIERFDLYITKPKPSFFCQDAIKVGVRFTYTNDERWCNVITCSLSQLKEALVEMETRQCVCCEVDDATSLAR